MNRTRFYRTRVLLFEKGQGWLRWGTDKRESWVWESNACASYCEGVFEVAPPARRLVRYLRQWIALPRLMLVGYKDDDMEKRYRFSWEEVQPIWPSDMRDPDRERELAAGGQ